MLETIEARLGFPEAFVRPVELGVKAGVRAGLILQDELDSSFDVHFAPNVAVLT